MYIFFRLLRVGLKSHFQKKQALFDNYYNHFITWPTDLDIFMHMNNGRYFSIMDLARFDYIIRAGFYKKMREAKWYPIVTAETVQFKKSLQLFDRFTVKTKLLGWNEKSMFIKHVFICKNQIYAIAIIKGMVLNKNREFVSPQQLLETMGYSIESPELPEWIQKWAENQRSAIIEASTSEIN